MSILGYYFQSSFLEFLFENTAVFNAIVAGVTGSGIPKRKVRKAVKSTGKFLNRNKGKIARSALNLASAFGSEDTKQKADNIRLAHEIVKGSGAVAPGAALRKLVS